MLIDIDIIIFIHQFLHLGLISVSAHLPLGFAYSGVPLERWDGRDLLFRRDVFFRDWYLFVKSVSE